MSYTLASNANNANEQNSFFIGNSPGMELPATGGSGATAYYTLGAGIALGAGLLLARRKKRKA